MDLFITKNRRFLKAIIAVTTNPVTGKKLAGHFDNTNYHITPSGITGASFVLGLYDDRFEVRFEVKNKDASTKLNKLTTLVWCNTDLIERAFEKEVQVEHGLKNFSLIATFDFKEYSNSCQNHEHLSLYIVHSMCVQLSKFKQALLPYLLLTDNSEAMQKNIGISRY